MKLILTPRPDTLFRLKLVQRKVSRWQRWVLKMKARKRCVICGAPVEPGLIKCLRHAIKRRERDREKFGRKRQYSNAITYLRERGIKSDPAATI